MARKKPGFSSVILITFAEFAWLGVFGLLFLTSSLKIQNDQVERELTEANAKITKLDLELINTFEEVEKIEEQTVGPHTVKYVLEGFVEDNRNQENELRDAKSKYKASIQENESLKAELLLANKKLASLEKLNEEIAMAKVKNETLEQTIYEIELENSDILRERNSAQAKKFSVRKELLGLKVERLERVVVLFDRSDSMASNEFMNWNTAQSIIKSWLMYLPFQYVSIVSFNSKVKIFPEQDSGDEPYSKYLKVRDSSYVVIDDAMDSLIEEFESKSISGGTNTLGAFEAAYKFSNVDLIILFTDGKPELVFQKPKELRAKILDVAKQNKSIPLFVVAIGEHDKENVLFLKELASLHEQGGFIAR